MPVGGLHAFRNESGETASMLLMFAPGAPREGYFRGLVEGMQNTMGQAFFLEHDQYNVKD